MVCCASLISLKMYVCALTKNFFNKHLKIVTTFTRLEVPRPSCSRDWTSLVALALSGAPLWRSSWNQRAWGPVGVPIQVSIQLGSIWEALAGEEEHGGREEQRTSGDGRRGVGKRQHSGGVPF